jgi:hypothetical protein
MIIGITVALVLYLQNNPDITIEIFVGILVGSYFLYLIVGCNKFSTYLDNIDKGEHFEGYYD